MCFTTKRTNKEMIRWNFIFSIITAIQIRYMQIVLKMNCSEYIDRLNFYCFIFFNMNLFVLCSVWENETFLDTVLVVIVFQSVLFSMGKLFYYYFYFTLKKKSTWSLERRYVLYVDREAFSTLIFFLIFKSIIIYF